MSFAILAVFVSFSTLEQKLNFTSHLVRDSALLKHTYWVLEGYLYFVGELSCKYNLLHYTYGRTITKADVVGNKQN